MHITIVRDGSNGFAGRVTFSPQEVRILQKPRVNVYGLDKDGLSIIPDDGGRYKIRIIPPSGKGYLRLPQSFFTKPLDRFTQKRKLEVSYRDGKLRIQRFDIETFLTRIPHQRSITPNLPQNQKETAEEIFIRAIHDINRLAKTLNASLSISDGELHARFTKIVDV